MALSPYEVAVKKAKAEKEERLRQERQPEKDPSLVDVERRLDAIRRETQRKETAIAESPKDRSLITCNKCRHLISNRAESCPKCGSAVHTTCNICKRKIPKSSTCCPECGDPDPFTTIKEHVEAVAIPKVRKIRPDNEASTRARKQPQTHQKIAARSPLRVLFSFQGRINRQQFWLYSIPTQSTVFIWYIFLELFKEYNRQVLYGGTGPSWIAATLLVVFGIPVCWTSLAINVKRLHDRDKSFMWIFLFSVPVIGTVWWLVELGFLRGTVGRNKYGDDPLQIHAEQALS